MKLGTSAVVHLASNLSFKPDPNEVIPEVLAGVDNILEATTTEPKVKRFVFTSSSLAAVSPVPDVKFDIDENSWNEECIKEAWAPGPYESPREWSVYGASKTQAEQAVWKFAKEKKPHFEVNTVLPNANFGPILSPDNQPASTAAWVTDAYTKGVKDLLFLPPRTFSQSRSAF